jgi:hypothetical protein
VDKRNLQVEETASMQRTLLAMTVSFMDMFVLVPIRFDFQAGKINAIPAGDGYRKSIAFGAGGI